MKKKFFIFFLFFLNSFFGSWFGFGKKNKNEFLEKIKNYKINSYKINERFFWNNIALDLKNEDENKDKSALLIQEYAECLAKEFNYILNIKGDDEFLNYLNSCYKYIFLSDIDKDNIFFDFIKNFLNFIINDDQYEFKLIKPYPENERLKVLDSFVFKYLSYLTAYNFYLIQIKGNEDLLKIDYTKNEKDFKDYLKKLLNEKNDNFISNLLDEQEYQKYFHIYLYYLYKITILNKPEEEIEETPPLKKEATIIEKKEDLKIEKLEETIFKEQSFIDYGENIKKINIEKEKEFNKEKINEEKLLKLNENLIKKNNEKILEYLKKEEENIQNKKILDVFQEIEEKIKYFKKNIKNEKNPFYLYFKNLSNLYFSFKEFVSNKIENELNLNLKEVLNNSLVDLEKNIEKNINEIRSGFSSIEKFENKISLKDQKKIEDQSKLLIENYSKTNKIENSIKSIAEFSKHQIDKIKTPFYKLKDYLKDNLEKAKDEILKIKI